jgi:hypothetical protein
METSYLVDIWSPVSTTGPASKIRTVMQKSPAVLLCRILLSKFKLLDGGRLFILFRTPADFHFIFPGRGAKTCSKTLNKDMYMHNKVGLRFENPNIPFAIFDISGLCVIGSHFATLKALILDKSVEHNTLDISISM